MWFIRILGRLPLPILYALSSFLSFILYRILGYRKKVVQTNLKNSFPSASDRELSSYTRDFYKRFTDYAVETLHVVSMDLSDIQRHCKVTWDDELNPLIEKESPVLILTSHIFNWEWTLHAFRGVMSRPFAAVYQRLTNSAFDAFMLELRTKTGGQAIEKSNVMRYLAKHRDDMPGLVMLADQSPQQGTQKHWTKFLNQDTAFFLGPEMISYLTRMPVFFYRVRRVSRGQYAIHIEYLSEPPSNKGEHDIIEAYVRSLETAIREDPPAYLWSHKRWKLKKETED